MELNKHVNLKHILGSSNSEFTIKCRTCGEQFSDKWNLMNHRKKKYLHAVAPCRNNSAENCNFSADMCWWNHEIKERRNEATDCFV